MALHLPESARERGRRHETIAIVALAWVIGVALLVLSALAR